MFDSGEGSDFITQIAAAAKDITGDITKVVVSNRQLQEDTKTKGLNMALIAIGLICVTIIIAVKIRK